MLKRLASMRAAWLVLPALAVLAACSSIPLRERETARRDLFHKYAGPPIDGFTYLGRYDGWASIGRYELVVWTTINDAYLITVSPPCEDLQFANRIGLTQTAHQVTQRFDFVKVGHWKCMIKTIQPVNYLAMKKEMRQKSADARAAPRDDGD